MSTKSASYSATTGKDGMEFKRKKKVIIVGAGVGGTATAARLAHQGDFDVEVYEKVSAKRDQEVGVGCSVGEPAILSSRQTARSSVQSAGTPVICKAIFPEMSRGQCRP